MGYDMNFVRRGGDDYFRINIFGMGRFSEAMYRLGMAYDSKSPGGWPERPCYPDDATQGLFEAACEHVEYGAEVTEEVPEAVMTAAREHVAAQRAILAAHPDGGHVIPLHKFSTNDGWIVTPDEIVAALAEYLHRTDGDEVIRGQFGDSGRPRWDAWIDYLRRAVEADGFEVW